MKVNLANLCRQAALAIDPEKDTGIYAWMLGEEVPRLINEVESGQASLADFAALFCIKTPAAAPASHRYPAARK